MNPRLARAMLTFPIVLLPLVVLVPLPRAAAAEGGVFSVDSTEDGIDATLGDGVCATAGSLCTLRAAVMEANAGPTADRIELGSGVYYLSITGLFEEQAATGDLDIYGTLTLVGQGMTLTIIDAGGAAMGDRALHIHPGATFRLEGVSVFDADIGMGSNGAGLRNDSGNVVIQGASFQFSRAHNGAGLMNVGEMVIRNSLIWDNTATDSGGGVRNDGTLEIESSTLMENEAQAGPGGAIENHGTLTIRNSTISNNRTGSGEGAIYNGYGPGSDGSSLTINNSTIFANLALTGDSAGPATGGIYNVEASSVQLSNSIVALNGVNYTPTVDCLGPITSLGHNLFSSIDECALSGDLGSNIVTEYPKLGQREEDPAHTASFPLLPDSPALEAGNPAVPGSSDAACEPADQRGIFRPQVARCDIGAREMEGTPPPSPTPPAVFVVGLVNEDGVDANPGDGVCATAEGRCTLRAAVMETNALPTADRIELGPLVYYLTIPGAGEDGAATGDLDILGDLELIGSSIYTTLIDGGGSDVSDRTLHVHPSVDFRMSGAGVANAKPGSGGDGGALFNDRGSVTLEDAAFQFNFARNGGALMNTGEMTLRRTLVYGNDAGEAGGGIRNEGHLEIYESTVGGNHVDSGPGGGIDNRAELDLWNSTVTGNNATHLAAAIYNGPPVPDTTTRLRLNSATIYSNLLTIESAGSGGIYNEPSSEVLISNTILSGNANSLGESSCWGTVSSGGHNLFGTSPDCLIEGDTLGNLYGFDDPGLGMLGGDGAPTHPLLPGSPAIDAGKLAPVGGDETACPFTDQRGVPRPQGEACDIGAYEAAATPPTPTPVTPPVITYTVTPTPMFTPTSTQTSSVPSWSTTTSSYRADFGFSVSGAGDVNGDGYDDLLVGARGYENGESSEGGAFLFYGAPAGPGTTPDWVVESNQANAIMGHAVAGAGDVNGDGYDDILVSAYLYSAGQTSEGAAFAYYGSASGLSETPNWTAEGNQAGAYFGWSVSGAGDVNRDGYGDVVVGSRYYSGGQSDEGRAQVYLGSPTGLQSAPVWQHEIDIPNAGFGYSVSRAGDVNGDGYDDILIGSYNYIYGQLNGGKAYIFWGTPSGIAESPAWIGDSGVSLDGYGYDVAYAGDVNGDGHDDILVGAPGESNQVEGRAYLYLGSNDGPTSAASWIGEDGRLDTRFGASLDGACDVNNDGYDDYLVGDPNDRGGKAHFYLGGPAGPLAASSWSVDPPGGGAFGASIGRAGRVDGDRYCDFLAGNPLYGNGYAYLYTGYAAVPGVPTITPSPSPPPTDTLTPTPTSTLTATPTPLPSTLFADGFETGDLSAWSSAETDQGDLSVSPGAALGGAYGLHADIDDNRSLYVVDTTPSNESAYAARFYFDPSSIPMASGNAHLLFKALDATSRTVYQIELRSYQGDYQVRAQAIRDGGSATNTSWFRLHDDVHAIETIWQAASADGASNGSLTLGLDGESVASLAGLDNDTLRVEAVRLGAVAGIDSGTRGIYFFDAFGSTAGGAIGPDPGITLPSPLPTPDAVFADGFESGDLSAWSAVTIGTDLAVSSSAALGGGFGLEAIVDDTAPRYVSDWTPVSLKSYAARFYFDPNGIRMASGNSHVLFRALDFAARTAFQIELRSYQGEYQIRAYAPWDSGGSYSTPWYRIHDDLHSIEAVWQASSAEGAIDGALALWLDGELAASGSGIDNDTRRVDKVDLGAVTGLDSGTSGTYYFDAFASTSGNPLGPDPGITLPSPPATPEQIFDDGFESGDLSAWSAVKNETDLIVSSSAALGGGFGLQSVVDDTAPRYVSDWSPVSLKAYAARFYFDPNGITMASGNSHVLFKAVDAVSKTAFQFELRSYQGDYQIRAYAPWDSGGAYTSPWFRLSDDPHLLEVIWQAASGDGANDGWLSLSIDSESVAGGSGLDNDTRRVDKIDLGAVAGLDSGTSGTYYFDAFASTTGIPIGPDPGIALPTPPSPADEIFANGFEAGGLSAWSALKNEGDLLVNNGSALAGGYGLEAIADDTAPRYVTDWSPVAEKEYHVRFVFDPNSLTMLDGRSHVMFQALSGSSKVIARVELRVKSLNYELRGGILTDANQWVNTGWWYIDDAPQVIELDWRAASRPDSSDGSLTMWINEEQAESRDGIANSLLQVDLAQMGLVAGVDSGTLGSMQFDSLESRRWSHIGLPDDLATPVPTGTPTVTPTKTPTATPTVTPALTLSPDCGNIALNYTDLWSAYVRMSVTNQNPYPIHLTDSTISWGGPGVFPGQALGRMYFDGYYWTGNDPVSPSSHAPELPIAVAPGETTIWYGYFYINAPPLSGSYSVSLTFDDACVVSGSVNRDPPTVTVTPTLTGTDTPTRTVTPTRTPNATRTPTPEPTGVGSATVTATPTAGAASCELIRIERYGFGIDRLFVKVVNDNPVPVSLTGSHINWPDRGDGYLDWLEFGARYYEGDDPEPPTSVSLSPPIALAGDSSQFWIAMFPYGVVGWPEDWWDIELEFDNVCKVSLGFSILTPTPTWVP